MMIRWLMVLGLMGSLIGSWSDSASAEEWKSVFSGEGLEGWEVSNEGAWRRFDNILNGQGPGGSSSYLVGPDMPGDFALRLQYKVIGQRQGAIHFRTHWLDDVMYGYKVVLPPLMINPLVAPDIDSKAGDLYLAGKEDQGLSAAADIPNASPVDLFREWDSLYIRAVGGNIEVEINGTIVSKTENDRYIGGRIAFESQPLGSGGMVLLQNIEYQDLSDESDYTTLFNGKDLSGWKVHGEKKQWVVKDGVIKSESVDDAYSYLATENQYRDFSIKAEFLGLAGGNSGLFFHSHLDGTNISGIQSKVQPPNGDRLGHSGCLYDSSGRGWLIDPKSLAPEKEAVFRMGEWNTMQVDVKDHRIKTWLNGMQIVDYQDENPKHDSGAIALQIHSGGGVKVDWRNLRVKELE